MASGMDWQTVKGPRMTRREKVISKGGGRMSKKAKVEHPYDYNCNCYQCYETWQYRQELPYPGPASIERDLKDQRTRMRPDGSRF